MTRAHTPSRSRVFAFLTSLLCLVWYTGVGALTRDGTLRDLRHTAWGPKQNPFGEAQALAQTTDGYLWIGAANGLYRFDGIRFENIDIPRDSRILSVNIYKLYAPPTGGLWIGFLVGGAAFMQDGHFTFYGKAEGLQDSSSVVNFAQDRAGTIWAATGNGLKRLDGAGFKRVGPTSAFYDKARPEATMVDSTGTLWVASKDKVQFLPNGELLFREATVQPRRDIRTSEADNVGIAESPTGELWLLRDQQLRRLRRNENPGRQVASSGFGFMFDRDGSMWIEALAGRVQRIAHPEELPSDSWVRTDQPTDAFGVADGLSAPTGSGAMIQDSEGNVWIVSEAGLDRFSERNVSMLLPAASVHEAFYPADAMILPGGDGSLWVGGRTFPLFNVRDGHTHRYDDIGNVSAAAQGSDGSLFFGSGKCLWSYSVGRFQCTELPDVSFTSEPIGIAQEKSGAVWLGNHHGLYRLTGGAWVHKGGLPQLPDETADVMTTDAMGRVWVTYPASRRVASIDGAMVTLFEEGNVPIGFVNAIYGQRSAVWAAGTLGVARLEGAHFVPLRAESGLSLEGSRGIVEDAAGGLWLNASAGIIHIAASELKSAAQDPAYGVHGTVFDVHDGVEGIAASQQGTRNVIETADGRLLFLTNIGLYEVDPSHLRPNPVPPGVVIQSLTADDKVYTPSHGLKLPQRTTALRIDYTGLDLTMPEKLHYRYKLDGVDAGWQDVQGRRQAFYTNLSPGPHRFQVLAASADGVWNETGDTLDFFIPPAFVQTGWFVALCMLGLAAAVALVIRFRFRQLAAGMRIRYEERMAERERIARELHDTLLQGTQALVLKVQSAVNRVAPGEPMRRILEEALDGADQVIAEGRDRIQDLRIAGEADADFAKALSDVGEELACGQSTHFGAVVEGTPRSLSPIVRDEAYRIGREALLNAFRHAEAKSIEVQIIFADDYFRVRVRDDGVGVDPEALRAGSRPGHWGLPGMRERATKAGAEFGVWSRSGAGTEIEVKIPAATAYVKDAVGWWWRPFLGVSGSQQ